MPLNRSRLTALAAAVASGLAGLGLAVLPAQVSSAAPIPLSSSLPANSAAALATNYAPPAGAIFVSTGGADTNAGTQAAPFKTLSKAMATVQTGGTIVLRGGVYRQGASATSAYNLGGTYYFVNMKAGVTVQAYPGETVWFDGSQQVTSWTQVSATDYTTSWSTPDFCSQKYYTRNPTSQANDGPCSYPDSIGAGSSIGDPQMVFRNGTELTQVASLAEMTSDNTFYYDWANKKVHVRFDPAGDTVEVTKFAQAMALYKPTNFAIKGIGFRRYASNQVHNATAAALLLNLGSNVLLENTAFTQNAGTGVQAWQTTGLTIRRSVLSSNGANGLNYDGNWQARGAGTTPADNLTIEYSRLDGNNADRYGVNCSWSCGAAGAKLTGTAGMTVRYSSFSKNGGGRGSGFWCDMNCKDLKAYGNAFIDNDRHGLIYEIGDKAIIASNLFVHNGWRSPAYGGGYGMYVGSAHVRMYNNTLVDNRGGVGIYDDGRQATTNLGGYNTYRIGPDTVGTEFVNNILTGGSPDSARQIAIGGGNMAYAGNTTATQQFGTMSNNSYYKPGTGAAYWLAWNETSTAKTEIYTTVASFTTAHGMEQNSQLSTGSTDPYLANPTGGDYSLKSGSTAVGTARALPADIAALFATGVNAGNRGVITLDGQKIGVTAAPAPAPTSTSSTATSTVVSADFSQAVTSGWGAAGVGGNWAVSGTGFSVADGLGKLSLAPSGSRSASLDSVSAANVEARLQVALDKAPAGGQAHVNLNLRGGDDGAYRMKVRVSATGVVSVLLARVVGTTETVLASRTLTGYTYTAGDKVNLAVQVTGSGTTSLRARAWAGTQAQPTDWPLAASDSTATLQDAGEVGVSAWLEGSVSNGPVQYRFDNLQVTKI